MGLIIEPEQNKGAPSGKRTVVPAAYEPFKPIDPVIAELFRMPSSGGLVIAPAAEQGELFFTGLTNLRAKIQDGGDLSKPDHNRDVATYIEADPRYLDFYKTYLNELDTSADDKAYMLETAVKEHEIAANSVNEADAAGKFNTDVFAISENFYGAILQEYKTPGVDSAPPAFDADLATARLGAGSVAPVEDGSVATIITPSNSASMVAPIDEDAYNATQLAAREAASLAAPDNTPAIDTGSVAAAASEDITKVAYTPHTEAALVGEQARAANTDAAPGAEEPKSPAATTTDYVVKSGDNLTKIATEIYSIDRANFESNKDYQAALQQAVGRIVEETGTLTHNGKPYSLAAGANANSIWPDQVLKIPAADTLDKEIASDKALDWSALAKGGKVQYASIAGVDFKAAAEGTVAESQAHKVMRKALEAAAEAAKASPDKSVVEVSSDEAVAKAAGVALRTPMFAQ